MSGRERWREMRSLTYWLKALFFQPRSTHTTTFRVESESVHGPVAPPGIRQNMDIWTQIRNSFRRSYGHPCGKGVYCYEKRLA